MTRKGSPGFALLFVIWISALIATIAIGLVVKVRTNTLVAANLSQSAGLEAIADGMARFLAVQLAERSVNQVEGSLASCAWDNQTQVNYAIQDQAGLVDLNTAPEFLLTELLTRLSEGKIPVDQTIAAIIDYRDADSQAQSGGLEPQVYEGRKFGPKNAPFETVEELDQIPTLDETTYRRLKPLVTVDSFEVGIDINAAPKTLRSVLGQAPIGDFTGLLSSFTAVSQRKAFAIDVRVQSRTGARFRRIAHVYLTGQPDRPFAFVSWRRGEDWAEESVVAATPCITQ